jgi:hypothetical protein
MFISSTKKVTVSNNRSSVSGESDGRWLACEHQIREFGFLGEGFAGKERG